MLKNTLLSSIKYRHEYGKVRTAKSKIMLSYVNNMCGVPLFLLLGRQCFHLFYCGKCMEKKHS